MIQQRILLGDCLDVFANERNVPAFVADPPANIAFMGRSWDRAHPATDYVPMIPTRDKAHLRELQSEFAFSRYWATRYAMAYDIADQHATAIIWTLPRTSHQTANALRAAGWSIKDNLVHLFGTGWAKSGNALAPGQEGWLLATKGKPDLDIDACRVLRGAGDVSLKPNKVSRNQHVGFLRPWNDDPDAVEAANERSRESQAKTQALGSIPKNAILSHCEECVRVGSRDVKRWLAEGLLGQTSNAFGMNGGSRSLGSTTESVPAWHCLAGCVCGARSTWDPEKPLPRCPCGEMWRWLCVVAEVNSQSGLLKSGIILPHHVSKASPNLSLSGGNTERTGKTSIGDQGGASRFFNTFQYLAKCSPSERHAGCENLFWRANKKNPFGFDQVTREEWETLSADERAQGNVHPTVKSYRLMRWLHSLTGANKIVDLSAGSGTGMFTAALDGIEWIGAEVCPEAVTIAQARHAFWAGLSFEARRAMIEDAIVLSRLEPDERQVSLF
jgi:site-specific DNA-methyltransferase (adenine-specific)